MLIYLAFFGIGKIVLGHTWVGAAMCLGALSLGCYINFDLKRRNWKI